MLCAGGPEPEPELRPILPEPEPEPEFVHLRQISGKTPNTLNLQFGVFASVKSKCATIVLVLDNIVLDNSLCSVISY